tara:strand:- start:641 stop:790 length:150 start_codon:yes stop_codon:yes gene_type:complete
MEGRQKIEAFKVETPVGSFESDSGSHIVDVLSVFIVVAALYVFKKFVIK